MNTKSLVKLSKIIDKMEIKDQLTQINKKTKEEIGTEIIALLMCNLHKAEEEVYEFIASYCKCTLVEAEEENVYELFKGLLNVKGIKDFLAQQ